MKWPFGKKEPEKPSLPESSDALADFLHSVVKIGFSDATKRKGVWKFVLECFHKRWLPDPSSAEAGHTVVATEEEDQERKNDRRLLVVSLIRGKNFSFNKEHSYIYLNARGADKVADIIETKSKEIRELEEKSKSDEQAKNELTLLKLESVLIPDMIGFDGTKPLLSRWEAIGIFDKIIRPNFDPLMLDSVKGTGLRKELVTKIREKASELPLKPDGGRLGAMVNSVIANFNNNVHRSR